ncbi:hypothetical protein FRC12_022944 [Ceratobasidium sp. 428]|nr:hypothetical protein FRC12_022944 [Ceratobasidium sp. 428]
MRLSAGTKDSARSLSEAIKNIATLKLVQIALDIIIELAKNGTSVHDQITMRHLSRTKFYDEQTTSKAIALMKDDKQVIYAALRSLAALAVDRRNVGYFMHDGFAEAIKQSLSDSADPTLVTQAIQTITAIAEDRTIDEYLVNKGIIPQILRVLSISNQTTGRRGAIKAIRRLSNNDTARSQLFENDVISTLRPVIESSPDALHIIESLAAHTEARRRMIENETFATVASLIDSTSQHVARRAMYVVTAFAAYDDGRREVVKLSVVRKIIPRLQEDFMLCDALNVVINLVAHGNIRPMMTAESGKRLYPSL